jgi:carbon monoxide dehydrogenase subunit G
MTKIESDAVLVNQPPSVVFAFLKDLNNHKELMPEQVVDWSSTATECTFTIKGTATLSLKLAETKPDTAIRMVPKDKPPFDFDLEWQLDAFEGGTRAQAVLNADLNMFLKMLAVKPLTNFLNFQAEGLKNYYDGK